MKLANLRSIGAVAGIALALAGCSGGGGGSDSGPRLNWDIKVPNVDVGKTFSFDLGAVNQADHRYYLTDRTNKSLDVFDSNTLALVAQVTGTGAAAFTGISGGNSTSGPDGLNIIPGTTAGSYFVYVGDVNKVNVVDSTSLKIVSTLVLGGASSGLANMPGSTKLRADEGCYDNVHKIYVLTTPEVDAGVAGQSPYLSVMDVSNPSAPVLKAQITFFDPTDPTGTRAGTASAGLEQCAYDPVNDQFLINNDGSVANPLGEVNAFSAAAVAAIPAGTVVNHTTLAGFKQFSSGPVCNNRGLALGPGTTPATAEFIVECSGATGKQMTSVISNRASGAILATVPFGGGDAIAYDAASNRYYATGSGWNHTGIKSTTSEPAIGVIDAASRTLVTTVPVGNGSHSVAIDGSLSRVFVPYTYSTQVNQGQTCATCAAFPTGGISVLLTQ